MNALPTFFISHGGGPWPWMEPHTGGMYAALTASLQQMMQTLPRRPRAVLMISGHWEARPLAVMAAGQPGMVYDYYGFPAHTYRIRYNAPGAPLLAGRVQDLLLAAGLPAVLDTERGFDHGAFVPMAVMAPDADIPLVQLSLHADYDPAMHLAIGRALAPLRDEDVLIVGSGLSWHNLRRMGAAAREPSARFDAWLQSALAAAPVEREQALLAWESAPAARDAHPREDHLLPLLVAVGAAYDEPARCIYHETDFFGGVTVSSFQFGAAAPP